MGTPLPPIGELIGKLRADLARGAGVMDGEGRSVHVARAPGRLDVLGGIADYTGSLVCEMPLEVGAAVAVQRREDRQVVLQTYNAEAGESVRVELSLDDFYGTAALLPVETVRARFKGADHWAAYVAGAYYVLAKHRKLTRRAVGANIACYSTVPLGAGVSSSAALEVAAMSALMSAYQVLLEPLEAAVYAQRVENAVVGAPCGVMDQVTSMLGRAGKLLLLHCQPHTVEGYVDVPRGVMFAGINSNVKHSVGGSAYRNTRVAAFMAQAIIAKAHKDFGARKDPTGGYLANVEAGFYRTYLRPILPRQMTGRDFLARYGATVDRVTKVEPGTTYAVRAAADHHVLENARVRAFVGALKAGDEKSLRRAGRLMVASHASYGQRARLGSKETDLLVRKVLALGPEKGFYGAKITGGGSGGTVAVMCRDDEGTRAAIEGIAGAYKKETGLVPHVFTGSGPGAADSVVVKMKAAELAAG